MAQKLFKLGLGWFIYNALSNMGQGGFMACMGLFRPHAPLQKVINSTVAMLVTRKKVLCTFVSSIYFFDMTMN